MARSDFWFILAVGRHVDYLRLFHAPTDGECAQTIVHPALSVWAVSTMPNGDIVSGCSDGVVRVFSQAKERWASDEDLKEYDDMVARQALPAHQIGDVKKTDLPGLEALATPGASSTFVYLWIFF
jgi:phospholipase A-2-activating protein